MEPEVSDGLLRYRSIPTSAVLGVIFGLLSSSLLLVASQSLTSTLMLAPIPIVGLLLSLAALRAVRNDPDSYTGGGMAMAGAGLSAVLLCVGVGLSGYVYATEVPEGYQRLSFLTLKPSPEDETARRPIPKQVEELAGKKIFIKGYIRPDSTTVRKGMKRFLLVRDNQECCFGDISKVKFFDQMQIELQGDLTCDYSQRVFRVAGELLIDPMSLARGPNYPVFSLNADYLK